MAEPSAELQELDQGIRRLKGELEAQAREAGIDPSKYTSASFTSLNEEKIRPNMQNMQQLVITFISGDEAKAWHEANVRDVPSKWRFGSSLRQYYPDPRFEKGARSVQAEL